MGDNKEDLSFQLGVLIGEMKGVRDDLSDIKNGQNSMDKRLRSVEVKSSIFGLIGGALSGFALIVFRGGNGGPHS